MRVALLGHRAGGGPTAATASLAMQALSPRRTQLYLKVNCGELPAGLLEAELFGYELGAFTGATRRHVGLVRVAHGGTRTVEGGSWVQVFVPGHDPREKQMHYSLKWTGEDGHPYLLSGVKTILGDRPWAFWAAHTTLFTTIYRGDSPSAPVLERGILRINLRQVLAKLASLRAHSRVEHLKALARFGRFCVGTLWETYVHARGCPREPV